MANSNIYWYVVIALIALLMVLVVWGAMVNETMKQPVVWDSCIWDD